MMTDAPVVYKNSSYFGFARKANCPAFASSIFPKLFTSTSGSPSSFPLISAAIWAAENCIAFNLNEIQAVSSFSHQVTNIEFFNRHGQASLDQGIVNLRYVAYRAVFK